MPALICSSPRSKALRRAPKSRAIVAACSEVGPRAKERAWTTEPSGGSAYAPPGSLLAPASAFCARWAAAPLPWRRAQSEVRTSPVPHEIVVDLGVADDQPPAGRFERRSDVLRAAAREAVPVLDHDGRDGGIGP
jgi:hypothetical protein